MLTELNTLLLVLGLLLHKNADALDLNFQQNDYKLKFEWAELIRYNHKFLKEFSIVTFKYNRTLAAVNSTLLFNVNLDYNLECIIQAYKFMSNEYRYFPLRFSANCCKGLAANIGGLRTAMSQCGNPIRCPIRKGIRYSTCNLYMDASRLPPFIPNGMYKIEVQMLNNSEEVSLTNFFGTVSREIV